MRTIRCTAWGNRGAAGLWLVALAAGALAAPAPVPDGGEAFVPGETLEYSVSLGILPLSGPARLCAKGPMPLLGDEVVLLEFDIDAQLAGQRVEHHARSWVSSERQASLAYEMSERSPLGIGRTQVTIAANGLWRSLDATGRSATAHPLDELSMIYLVRRLPLTPGAPVRLDRHYDPSRNPSMVSLVGVERLTIGGRPVDTYRVVMQVKDARRFPSGVGELRIWLTADRARVPVRLELPSPLGPLVLTLKTLLLNPEEKR
jgi:hypothetical protein